MAQDDAQERTEQPTPKRLREAKEKGQVPRSREWNTLVVLMSGAIALLLLGENMISDLTSIFGERFIIEREHVFDTTKLYAFFQESVTQGFIAILPFMLILVAAVLFAPTAIGGFSFSFESMAPKLEKLNPIKGLGKIFGWRGLMELGKSILKVALVTVFAIGVMYYFRHDILSLGSGSLESSIAEFGTIYILSFLLISSSVVFIAAIDVPFQLWDHARQLKMTKQEVRDEMKETEGKPEVKGRIRQLQREMAQARMMQEVPKADVIVTNPTHYAVALKYDDRKMRAPKVVAKGTDLIAMQIRGVGQANNVAIFEAPPLARAIYYSTKLDSEIPQGLYVAVAQVLAYIFQLRAYKRRGGSKPNRPDDLPVPVDMYEGKQGIVH